MLLLRIFSIGKTKELWLENAIQEYVKRLSQTLKFEFIWAKNDEQLLNYIQRENSPLICLDPSGNELNSQELALFMQKKFNEGGSRLGIVIGGPSGLPITLKSSYPLLSLSRLTFTHQITRLILIEQIYRGLEIVKGSKYHK